MMLRLLPPLAFLLTLAACASTSPTPPAEPAAPPVEAEPTGYVLSAPVADSSIALIVRSEQGPADTLLADDFESRYQALLQRFQLRPDEDSLEARELRRRLAEQFVLLHVLGADTLARPEVTEHDADLEVARAVEERFGGDRRSMEAALAQRGLSLGTLRAQMQRDPPEELLRKLQLVRLGGGLGTVTPQEVDSARAALAEPEVRVRHILLEAPLGTPQAQADSVRAEAEALLDSLAAGTPFPALARRHSEGPSSAEGGDLGYFTRGIMVPPFEEAVFALSDSGQVALEPVRTQFGYHLVQLVDRRTAQPSPEEARTVLLLERQLEAMERGLERARSLGIVRLNPDVVRADLNDAYEAEAPEAGAP